MSIKFNIEIGCFTEDDMCPEKHLMEVEYDDDKVVKYMDDFNNLRDRILRRENELKLYFEKAIEDGKTVYVGARMPSGKGVKVSINLDQFEHLEGSAFLVLFGYLKTFTMSKLYPNASVNGVYESAKKRFKLPDNFGFDDYLNAIAPKVDEALPNIFKSVIDKMKS